MSREQQRMWRLAGKYSALGIEIAVAVALGAFLGDFVDQRFATRPLGLLGGFIVGVGAAISSVYRLIATSRRDVTVLSQPGQNSADELRRDHTS